VKYNARHNEGQIGNHQWASDWHHDHWPWTTFNYPSWKSSKLHVKYLKYGYRYDVVDVVNRSRIAYKPWTIDCQHNLW